MRRERVALVGLPDSEPDLRSTTGSSRHTRRMTERRQLGEALRAWRQRLTPALAGVPAGVGRRTAGLRREELAELAGVSIDYLTRMEQGRASNPSPQVVGALARALQLDHWEREALYRMAGAATPPTGVRPRAIPAGVQRITERLEHTPIAVMDAGWDVLEWNTMWVAVFGDPAVWQGRDRNLVWRHFSGIDAHVQRSGAHLAAHERDLVGELRLASARYPDDAELADLVGALRTTSAVFAGWWNRFDIRPRTGGHAVVVHESLGAITFDCDVLTFSNSDIKIKLFSTRPGSVDADKLERLPVSV